MLSVKKMCKKRGRGRDLPGGSGVNTSPSIAGSADLIPGHRAKIPHASLPTNQNVKQKQYCTKFNKDFKVVHLKINKNF